MSEAAITWAQKQRCPTSKAKFALMRLAAYADADGVAWAYVERLADEMQTTDRTVQRCLRALEKAGLLLKTGKFVPHRRNVPFYWMGFAIPDHLRTATSVSPLNGVAGVTVGGPIGDMGAGVNGDTDVAPKQGNPSDMEANAPISEHARAQLPDGFRTAFGAYPQTGRSITDVPAAQAAWAAALAVVSEPLLIAAVAAYAASPGLRRADSFGAPAMQRWLSEQRFLAFVPDEAPQGSPGAKPQAGFGDLRAAVVRAKGEAWAQSWLDPCWADEAGRTLHPRNKFVGDTLRREIGQLLRAHGVEIGDARGGH